MIPLPTLNSVCAYTFTGGFASLNGIYTVAELISFSEALTQGIDFTIHLYIPAGLSPAQYTTDASSYQNTTVLYLQPVNGTGTAIYVPSSLLATMPDPMVGCYNNLAIGVELGLFDDQTQLSWIISELNQIISATVGVTNAVKLYSLGTTYMSVSAYNALVAARKDSQSPYTTLYEQIQQQDAALTAAQALNAYYQNTLLALAAVTVPGGS